MLPSGVQTRHRDKAAAPKRHRGANRQQLKAFLCVCLANAGPIAQAPVAAAPCPHPLTALRSSLAAQQDSAAVPDFACSQPAQHTVSEHVSRSSDNAEPNSVLAAQC